MAIGITELLDVIKKSGLPIGDKLTKTQNELAAEDQIRSGIMPAYAGQFGQLDEEKKQKIQALANVDRQFSQLFGQGGKYALRNPMDVEQLTAGGQDIRMSDFNTTVAKQDSLLKAFEGDVSRGISLYDKIKPSAGGIDDSAALEAILGKSLDGTLDEILRGNTKGSKKDARPKLDDIFASGNLGALDLEDPLNQIAQPGLSTIFGD